MNLSFNGLALKSVYKSYSFVGTFYRFKYSFFGFLIFISASATVNAQNPIPAENLLAGTPASQWDISGAGDLTLQGFSTDISVNKGQTVGFKINITGTNKNFTINIYRLGYYQGNGARLIANLGTFTGVTQPSPITEVVSGLIDCGNWSQTTSWAVPDNAVSGVYIARLARQDNGGASHIAFVVRDDTAHASILYKTSDATWQGYNVYGGNSLYTGNTAMANGHAAKVSYNRPFITRNGGGGGGVAQDWIFNAEFPMIRWLERNGYYVSYTTDVDMERDATPIIPSRNKIMLSVGHDEYWSLTERNKFEAARDAGVHLAFFSGNEVYWKTRWEPSIDGSNTPNRTLVCYKEGTLGENVCGGECDPTNYWTGLWRDGCGATAPDGCKPENALTGQISWAESYNAMTVPAAYKSYRFWRNTSVATLTTGQTATLPAGTLGYEWDWEQPTYAGKNPSGRFTLSSTTVSGKTHKLSLYRHNSGALVFGAGTIQWSWGLDGVHDNGASTPSVIMQQATVNLFADMGVQPGSMQSGLVAATASTDVTSPATIITSPASGANLTPNVPVTITGTASDANVVAGIEVSVDGGITWQPATGTTSWTFSWTPNTPGSVTIKSRGFDDSGNMEVPGIAPANNAKTVTVAAPAPCPCTIWSPSTVPVVVADPDGTSNELGVKFRTSVNGYITGIRFYKSAANTGVHIGNLWTSTGTLLSTATFSGETASGWQEVTLGAPVAITAGTTYIASYHTNSGHYSDDESYFATSGVTTSYITALQDGTEGPNGVYAAGASAFPTLSFNASNYYVDVVFATSLAPDNTPPSVVYDVPSNGATGIATSSNVKIVFNEAIDPATVNTSTIQLRDPSNVLVPATVSYNTVTRTATLTPASALSYLAVYTIKVIGGTGTVIKDLSGNALPANFISAFTTVSLPLPAPTEGPGGPILVISAAANPFSRYPVELLRAEGINNFTALDISTVTATVLNNYDVVILGEIPLTTGNVTDLTNWTNAGGTLVAFKPDAKLNTLLGLTAAAGTLTNGYLLVNTATGPGLGIVNQTIQFHGIANLYTLNGATSLATLYSTATTATSNPAVTSRSVGSNGGMAVAFTFDLAKSVVYTRQGNPAQAGQKLDGTTGPVRSDDMFYPSWINFAKVAIPQADEQQHLLSNIIIKYNLHRKPLPRFWFLPKGLKAAVVMTGDDHALGGPSTFNRFNQYKSLSFDNSSTAVADWNSIRGTSYLFPGVPITDSQALALQLDGFEFGVHLNTGCANFTATSWQSDWTTQYGQLSGQLPSMYAQKTHRTHCVAWSDFATQAKKNVENGVRLDVNYYYYPGTWILDRPGMFTGSGMPMRFSDVDGTIIDCYQVATQLTDESGQTISAHISALLDSALGTQGYYGVFCANMHTDNGFSTSQSGSDDIVNAALARSVPVVSAKQMLDWLDGRNGSTFNALNWNGNQLSFTITAANGSRNMKAMLPVNSTTGVLNDITYNGSSITFSTQIIKGIAYAFFDATLGSASYVATYNLAMPPVISNVVATPNTNGTATITWNSTQLSDSKVSYGTTSGNLNLTATNSSQVTSHSITLTGLTQGTIYYFRVTSTDGFANAASVSLIADPPLNFVMPATPCAIDQSSTDFNLGTKDANIIVALEGTGTVILKPAFFDEFSGTSLTGAKWTSGVFNTGGTTVVSGGQVTVNGTHIYSGSSFSPGTSIEFIATFSLATGQNIGFSSNQAFSTTPWVVIGQGSTADGNLYARASDNTSVNLGSNLLGTAHRYRISWNTPSNTFSFYVDGNLVATSAIVITVSTPMYIQVSDFVATGGTLSVDWLRASPYSTPGVFTSRVFDHSISANWGIVNWTASTPSGTSLVIAGRTGNTAVPDGTWSAYSTLTNGNTTGLSGRYLQYRATLSNSNTNFTPALQQLSVACTDVNTSITITKHPSTQTICAGSNAVLVSKASSSVPIVVQWQSSTDGSSWTNIFGANLDTLTITAPAPNSTVQYRAKWANGSGTINSSAAIVSVSEVLSSQISKTNVLCFGQPTGDIAITGAGGTLPYEFSIDSGSTFSANGTFNNLTANSYLVRIKDAGGCIRDTTVLITQPAILTPTILKQDLVCLEDATGSITVTGSGGVANIIFSIDTGVTFNTTGLFTGLAAGNYTIRLKDGNNCINDSVVIVDVEKAIWTGAIDTDWHKAGNWNLLKVPTSNTHVIIPAGTSNECIVSIADAFVSSIQVKTGASIKVLNNFKIYVDGKCNILPSN